jgi:endonuclease/exonuclease/phosphatase family metal-dependent hydrolase
VLVLAVVVVAGERWTVGTAHLGLQPTVARSQLATALEALTTRPAPWVLAGDLNLEPPDVAPIADEHGFDLLDGPATFNARRGPTRRIDHVLTKGCRATTSGVTKLPVSDHLAVWADLG